MSLHFIDSHCHLDRIDLTSFEGCFDTLLAQASNAHVHHMLCVGIHPNSWQQMVELTKPYPNIFLSFGLHPSDLEINDAKLTLEDFAPYFIDPRVIAIGETGLDYHYGKDHKDLQKTLFILQIAAAIHYKKPLIIHTRDARFDTMDLLYSHKADAIGGVMHCFTEDWDTAKKALDLGFYISFSGIITFKNAECLREIVKKVPLDRLLIETDAPYLAPIPFRGKVNHPALVIHVAEKVAEIKNLSIETVAQTTRHNFQTLFNVSL